MKNLWLIFLILINSAVHAQAPGYMGKKITLKYDPAFFVSFIDSDNELEGVPSFGMHIRHDITATYAISTGVSIGLSYKYLPTHYYNYLQIDENDDDILFYGDVRRNTNCFGVIVQNFSYVKRGSIAPVGRFKSFELLMAKNSFKTISTQNYGATPSITFEELNSDLEATPLFVFIFGNGTQSVVDDKILLEFGWEIGISFTQEMIDMFDGGSNDKVGIDLSGEDAKSVDSYFKRKLAGPFFLNFTIGGGTLF